MLLNKTLLVVGLREEAYSATDAAVFAEKPHGFGSLKLKALLKKLTDYVEKDD